jgi:hypothetical protein
MAMRNFKSLIPAALLTLSLFGAAAPAQADIQGNDRFRVVGLSGNQTLKLMAGPARWSGVTVEVPFDARDLRATGVRQGIWVQLSFRGDNGYDYTGWAETQYLAADGYGQPTVYRVVNVPRRGGVPLMDMNGYGVRTYVAGGRTVLPACGPCQNGYCQVRYNTRRGTLEGLVDQANLAVMRPSDPGFSLYEEPNPGYQPPPSYSTTGLSNGQGYVIIQQPQPQQAYGDDSVDGVQPLPVPPVGHREHHWDWLFRY